MNTQQVSNHVADNWLPSRLEGRMNRTKFALAVIALTLSTAAQAMPEQVPDRWYDNMMHRIGVMLGNPGSSKAQDSCWCF